MTSAQSQAQSAAGEVRSAVNRLGEGRGAADRAVTTPKRPVGAAARGVEPAVSVEGAALAGPTWTIPLLFTRPPLHLNQRAHWTYRHRVTQEIHAQVVWQVRQQKIPPLTYPTVCLHWRPAVRRRRDADGPVATAKAALDALVVAKIIADDTVEHVNHLMPRIHEPAKPARMWLEIKAAE